MSPTIARSRIVGLGEVYSKLQKPVVDNPFSRRSPRCTLKWKFNMMNFSLPNSCDVIIVFTNVHNNLCAVWGTIARCEHKLRMRINREASHSVRSPPSWWCLLSRFFYTRLQPTMLHPAPSRPSGRYKSYSVRRPLHVFLGIPWLVVIQLELGSDIAPCSSVLHVCTLITIYILLKHLKIN